MILICKARYVYSKWHSRVRCLLSKKINSKKSSIFSGTAACRKVCVFGISQQLFGFVSCFSWWGSITRTDRRITFLGHHSEQLTSHYLTFPALDFSVLVCSYHYFPLLKQFRIDSLRNTGGNAAVIVVAFHCQSPIFDFYRSTFWIFSVVYT